MILIDAHNVLADSPRHMLERLSIKNSIKQHLSKNIFYIHPTRLKS